MKRLAKRAISECLRCGDRLKAASIRLAGGCPAGMCIALYYHGIGAREREGFARQMEELARRTTPLRANYTGPLTAGQRYAMVTFDDGFRSVVDNAMPVLRRHGVPATLFVPTGFLGQHPAWGKYAHADAPEECVLSESELRALRDDDLLEIGSHTVHHVSLAAVPDDVARSELVDSKRRLETVLEREVPLFSFPHGAFAERHLGWARAAGYERVFSIDPAPSTCGPGTYVVGRVPVDPGDPLPEFTLKLMGAYRWMARANAGCEDRANVG
jgi:peptidoglycan/xylan/chitin deacetylase (PgdA/CDA1 family)